MKKNNRSQVALYPWYVRKKPINLMDISIFLRQLATLIAAGLPIIKSFEILEKSQLKIAMGLLIHAIRKEILTGKNLSFCLRHHGRYFDTVTCQLVQLGEHTGKLDIILLQIATNKEKSLALKKQIKQILLYPCILIIFAFLVTLGLFIFIVPRFAELFSNAQVKLPWVTAGMFYFANLLSHYSFVFLLPILFVLFLLLPLNMTVQFKHKMLNWLLSLPLLRQFMQKITLTRFVRNLALMFDAGIPITDSLKLIIMTSRHSRFIQEIICLHNKLNSGLALHQAMQTLYYFPQFMIQMVKIGEESGMLGSLLNKLADFYESDIDHFSKQFSQLLEPLIILVLGVLIGGLVIGMYLPIFRLGAIQ